MTSKKQIERYPLESSPLFRIGRSKDLATLLRLSPKKLREIIVKRIALYRFSDEVINGKPRSLAVPVGQMRGVQERIKDLLGRVILPDYLYSPRRGRAASDNALAHLGARLVVKLDVKQFYPSTSDEHVFQFFHYRLGMVDDLAGRLTKLCTINGKVPFGSPLSPILCALVHDDIFSKAASRCELEGDTMSLWVDDLTISGDDVSTRLIQRIRRLIACKRMKAHKAQRVSGRHGAVITGTFIGPKGPAPSNKSHLKMGAKLREFAEEKSVDSRLKLAESLIGLVNHQLTIYPRGGDDYLRLKRRLQWLHNEFRNLKDATDGVVPTAPNRSRPVIAAGNSLPWA